MSRKAASALDDLSQDLERMFDSFLGRTVGNVLRTGSNEGYAPAVDLAESPKQFIVDIDLPGTKPEDVSVEFQEGVLTIGGKRESATRTDAESLKSERFEGTFRRSVAIAGEIDVDAIEATFSLGVLTVVLPKLEAKSPTKIKIKTVGE